MKNDKGEIDLQRVSGPENFRRLALRKPRPRTQAGEWRLTKPITAKVDELTINSLLEALADLKMQRQLEAVPEDKIKEFGLDKPIFTLEFQAAGQTHQLRFGHKAPGDQSIYAQKDCGTPDIIDPHGR